MRKLTQAVFLMFLSLLFPTACQLDEGQEKKQEPAQDGTLLDNKPYWYTSTKTAYFAQGRKIFDTIDTSREVRSARIFLSKDASRFFFNSGHQMCANLQPCRLEKQGDSLVSLCREPGMNPTTCPCISVNPGKSVHTRGSNTGPFGGCNLYDPLKPHTYFPQEVGCDPAPGRIRIDSIVTVQEYLPGPAQQDPVCPN